MIPPSLHVLFEAEAAVCLLISLYGYCITIC